MPDQAFSGVIPASGALTFTITSRPRSWRVSQVSVRGITVPAGSVCELRKNGTFVTKIRAGGGAAGGDPPVDLYPSDTMQVVLTGQTPGTPFEVFIIYEVTG